MTPSDRLIVALDVDTVEEAARLVKSLVPVGVTHFKVGLGLFTLAGPSAVEAVHRLGGKVFLDLKFHDIPATVSRAAVSALRLGVWMTNLHIQGGSAMMRKAVSAVKEEASRNRQAAPLLIGVTVLTSMAEPDLVDLGVRKTLKDQVLYLTRLAQSAGLDGIVSSAQEAKVIRFACGEKFLVVTPGIRLEDSPNNDQQRTATPQEAIRAGSDYLVVGRPVTQANDPVAVAQKIIREISECDRVN